MKEILEETVIQQAGILIENADKEYLKIMKTPEELIKRMGYELFFMGTYTKEEVDNQVKPIMEKNKLALYDDMRKMLR